MILEVKLVCNFELHIDFSLFASHQMYSWASVGLSEGQVEEAVIKNPWVP